MIGNVADVNNDERDKQIATRDLQPLNDITTAAAAAADDDDDDDTME